MTAYSSVLYSVLVCITMGCALLIAFSGLSYIPHIFRAQFYSAFETTRQGKMFPHGILFYSHVTITNIGNLMSGIVTAVTCLAVSLGNGTGHRKV